MAMHDIWNPWHGCVPYSEGCAHCYMFYLDRLRGRDGSQIYRTKNGFDYPLQRNRKGQYKVQSGEQIRVCMNSDFFLEEADPWRQEAWEIMRQRPDVVFFLLTKRPHRVLQCLPPDWGDGWEHIFFNVSCENQRRADERIPILLELPFRHKGIMCAPLIGSVKIESYLATGQIQQVICGGENYDGARPCDFAWVQQLHRDCVAHQVRFCFIETGSYFIKEGKGYHIPSKRLQSVAAYRSGMRFEGKPILFALRDFLGQPIPDAHLYRPTFAPHCTECGSRLICNGCADCRNCHLKQKKSG